MHEALERQKSVRDARQMKEMQCRIDSEYQASLRKREEERERTEKKREERTQRKPSSLSFIQNTRSCERPWITSMPVHKQSDVAGDPGCTQKSNAVAPNIPKEHKLPAINKKKEKKLQKVFLSSKNLGMQEQHEPSAPQMQIFSKRKKLQPRKLPDLLGKTEVQSARGLKDRDGKTILKQIKGQVAKEPDPVMEGSVQMSKPEAKDDCQQKKNKSELSSQPNANTRAGVTGNRTVILQAYRSPYLSSAPVSPATNGFLLQRKLRESSRVSTRRAQSRFSPLRFRDEDFFILDQNTEDAPKGNKDIKDDDLFQEENLSHSTEVSPAILNKTDELGRRTSRQIMHPSSGEECGDVGTVSSEAAEPFSEPLTQVAASPEYSVLDDNNKMERETSFSPTSANLQQQSDSTVASEPISTNQNTVYNTSSFCVHDEEMQARENPRGSSFASSARASTRTPILISSCNLPRAFIPSVQREVALPNHCPSTTSVGLEMDMNGSPRTPVTPRNRDSLTRVENQDSLLLVNQEPEASVRVPQNIMNIPNGPSPRGDPHGEVILPDSQRSSSTVNAPYPLALLNVASNHQLTGTLQEQLPFTLVTISDLQNQASVINRIAALTAASEKERNKPQADPEKLKKLQESLLEEESEEEGDLCRICQIAGGSPTNPLLEPCQCMGSLQFVHQECLKRWLKVKINSGAELVAVNTCELCKHSLKCDLDDFSVDEYYKKHQQSQAQNDLMDSGLYLVLLLHLYEQRYAELLRLSQIRTRRSLLFRNQPQLMAEDIESSGSRDGERYGNDNPNCNESS
ncbi:putative E3 ubiquitin-protein ligase MARCHF10 [Microcaecilia unicolor]|uniref:RING-type E3 ubiquitin transferase n=1 Tax=Microcaecilia unicolor TaxID=1415580 RepID=A0A6P7ZG68_9AMPH|nr:probable E3 ubiquitin-protein ligase MARCH10 [Microcaecilia unicolor]XP_030076884.1 probable E3 ubiquitin-protein ligase MARCH10 [Microcaecilia unicolor]